MTLTTIAFVLALAAVVFAAVAWITSWIRARESDLRGFALEKSVERQLRELEKKSPVNLAAEVATLADAVARVAATHRRFAGRFDMYVAKQEDEAKQTDDAAETPEQVRERLRIEHGLPRVGGVKPNGE